MGCCSKDLIVEGCCCYNCALEFPCTLGCTEECDFCCLSCKACCAIGEPPLPCCFCGPTCAANSTICKVKGVCFIFKFQGSIPCGDNTPMICTLLPFCTCYPKVSCCATTDSIVRPSKTVPGTGAPSAHTIER